MENSEGLTRRAVSREEAEEMAANWIARRSAPEWSASEAASFDTWLAESAGHRAAYYRLNAAWSEAGRLAAFGGLPLVPAPESTDLIRFHANGRVLAFAASVILTVVSVCLWSYRDRLFDSDHYHTIIGGLEAVPLADGSRVTLNTDSDVRVALTSKERRVDLDRGEAFFEVAKDARRPFVVNAGRKRVVAVGTQFSVFHEGNDVRVKVVEGAVRLEDRDEGTDVARTLESSSGSAAAVPVGAVLLSAGATAQVEKDAVLVRDGGAAAIEQGLSWRSGLLAFRDKSLSEVVAEFNRYNERQIVIEDPSIADLQFGGVFRSTNIDPFIELLEQGFPIRATIEGRRIILRHN